MTLLLDTCTLLWWWAEPARLSTTAHALIADPANEIRVSATSAWEIATKHRIGKFPEGAALVADWENRLRQSGFRELPITHRHALRAGSLPGPHRDPFDRMLAAQSLLEGWSVLSCDPALAACGAAVLW
jgi:PIN domain nuclease of toxin-antitoxin system